MSYNKGRKSWTSLKNSLGNLWMASLDAEPLIIINPSYTNDCDYNKWAVQKCIVNKSNFSFAQKLTIATCTRYTNSTSYLLFNPINGLLNIELSYLRVLIRYLLHWPARLSRIGKDIGRKLLGKELEKWWQNWPRASQARF